MFERIIVALFYSFLSALVGWVAGIVAMVICSGILFHGDAFAFALLIGFFSGPVVLLAWLFLLWPLYALVPQLSVFRRPVVCVACGVAAGTLLAASVFPLYGREYAAPLFAAPLIGGVTCAVGCKLNALQRRHVTPPT